MLFRSSTPTAIVNTTLQNPPAEREGADERILEDAWVLFEGGRIVGIGTGEPELPEGCEVLDGAGLHVYPGLIAGPTELGLIETEQVRATDDTTELDAEHPEIQAWIAINPDTPVSVIDGLIEYFDLVLVMSVHPGFSGQSFIESVLEKTREISARLRPDQRLEMDGGVGPANASRVRAAGCDTLVSALAIFGSDDHPGVIEAIRGSDS